MLMRVVCALAATGKKTSVHAMKAAKMLLL
jgi:hypothetical protein